MVLLFWSFPTGLMHSCNLSRSGSITNRVHRRRSPRPVEKTRKMEASTAQHDPPRNTAGVLAEFADSHSLVAAAAEVREAGYTRFDAYSPFPVHRIDPAMGIRRTRLPWIVLMEMYYITAREGGDEKALKRYAAVKHLPVTILESMDEPTLLAAARLKAGYAVSLADAMIAAFAIQQNALLVHKDPEYEVLAHKVRLEPLPYKTAGS